MLINGGTPLSPVPETNAGLHGAGDRRARAQLPPVLEGDVPDLSMSPVASSPSAPSAASLSAELGLRLEAALLPSDSESASESTVTSVSIADSAVTVSVGGRRKPEPHVQMTLSEGRKKSPRTSMLNKLKGNNLSRSSRTSLGTTSHAPSESAEDSRASTQPTGTLRRAASEPPRTGLLAGSAERAGSGSPPPSHGFHKQLSTNFEHATPPREKRRNTVVAIEKGKPTKTSPQPRPASSRESLSTSAPVPRLPSQRRRASQLEMFRKQRSTARHMPLALSEDAKDAFRRALLQGTHQLRCAKLGFVGPARAGKTSTLRALSGLPLRADEESTPGLACWALSQELLSAAPGHRWQLQDQSAVASTTRWDRAVAKYVADLVRPPSAGTDVVRPAATPQRPCTELDPSVMKRMPVDLIARRLGETVHGNPGQDEKTVVLEAYDFGGQDVYYAMHHLFLSDYGIYLACIDLSSLSAPESSDSLSSDLEKDEKETERSTQTWDALEWWLASIAVHAPNSPVAIVGTHDDCLPSTSRPRVHAEVHERITAFCKKLPELNEQLHINEQGQLCFFPMDNSGMDGGRSGGLLQKAVEEMVSKLLQGALGRAIPLRWSHFWAVLQRNGGNSGPLIKVEELVKRSARYGFESTQELQNWLRHFHGLGALLHFPEVEELRDLVCLKPSWVGDAAAAVLTAKDKVFQGCVKHVAELRERGMLHTQLLTAVWRQWPFARHHPQLVSLLQALDLLLAWGKDKQSQLQTPRGRQPATDVQKIYVVPSQLPLRPVRDAREGDEVASQDAAVLYFDFHGLLRRLLPTLIPRLLCSLSRVESGVQILSIYANYALFATSTLGQAQGDLVRSSGSRRTVSMMLVSVQPCGELLRCCLRPRRTTDARLSWKHVAWLLHNFREAVGAWMPRISFRAGIRCPSCVAGHAHVLELHNVLRDEDLAVCHRSGDLLEDLPSWLLDWRQHLQRTQPGSPRASLKVEEEEKMWTPRLHLEYLYASPLDVASLDVRAEIEALAQIAHVNLHVRTATTETLAEVWRTERGPSPRVLVLAAHCVLSGPARPSLLLEDTVGHAHVLGAPDLDELLALNGPEVAAGGKHGTPIFDVVVVDACHSEPLANRFVEGGATCAIGCAGEVFDAAAREFLRVFLRSLAAADGKTGSMSAAARGAFLAAQRAVRLSPQPGLRSEADHFCFVPAGGGDPRDSRLLPLAPSNPKAADTLFSHLPSPVEDFVGRGATIAAVASGFLGQRRVIWLHGKAGIGKSALLSEFCRFYAMPGDRLFSRTFRGPGDGAGPSEAEAAAGGRATQRGVQVLRVFGLGPEAVLERLRVALAEMPKGGPPTLLALDGVEESLAQRDSKAGELWSFLGEALALSSPLRLLLASREPRYDAPLPGKVVAMEVPPLSREDACLLLARRAHRPLFPRDLDSTCRPGGDPLALSTRRRELLLRLAQHPLASVMGESPAEVIAAAAAITPQLPSLFAHPLLQEEVSDAREASSEQG